MLTYWFKDQSTQIDMNTNDDTNEDEDVIEYIDEEQKTNDDNDNNEEKKVKKQWETPELLPEDITCIINMIAGCTRRGAFAVDEFDVILPVYQKLCSVVKEYPDKFKVTSETIERPEPFTFTGENVQRIAHSCTTLKKKKRKSKKRR